MKKKIALLVLVLSLLTSQPSFSLTVEQKATICGTFAVITTLGYALSLWGICTSPGKDACGGELCDRDKASIVGLSFSVVGMIASFYLFGKYLGQCRNIFTAANV